MFYNLTTILFLQFYRKAADLVTLGLSDSNSNINVSPKDVKVYTALANMLREYPETYQEAYELTKKAVKNEPQWEESHNMMGNCLLNLGRFSEARDAFKKSVSPILLSTPILTISLLFKVKVKPDYAIAHSNLGNAHQELGEMKEAEEHYRRALKLDENHLLTKFRLAKLISDVSPRTLQRLLEADAL